MLLLICKWSKFNKRCIALVKSLNKIVIGRKCSLMYFNASMIGTAFDVFRTLKRKLIFFWIEKHSIKSLSTLFSGMLNCWHCIIISGGFWTGSAAYSNDAAIGFEESNVGDAVEVITALVVGRFDVIWSAKLSSSLLLSSLIYAIIIITIVNNTQNL